MIISICVFLCSPLVGYVNYIYITCTDYDGSLSACCWWNWFGVAKWGVVCGQWCCWCSQGILKRMVWYFEEGCVVLWRGCVVWLCIFINGYVYLIRDGVCWFWMRLAMPPKNQKKSLVIMPINYCYKLISCWLLIHVIFDSLFGVTWHRIS